MAEVSTICAIATAPAAGGIGVIRVSGPAAFEAARPLLPDVPAHAEARRAYFTRMTDRAGSVLDEGLALLFRAPHSFTGEDVVELQAHGGPRLLSLLLAELLRDERLRLAQPGEVTRRAFLNGRIDLSRAEAIAALVSAESEAAVRAAAAQLTGALQRRVREVRAPLVELSADLEGVLNFPDEAEGADVDLEPRLSSALASARALLAEAVRGAFIRRGARVVLFGPVNAGKSTLFNRLVGAERALVDPDPGTTRDVLEARLELRGLAVTLVDTAGLRDDPGRVEQKGIARATEAVAGADLAVLLIPPEARDDEIQRWRATAGRTPVLEVASKADATKLRPVPIFRVSGLTGEGVDALREEIAQRLWGAGAPAAVFAASEANVDSLRRTGEALERALQATRVSTLEVVAGEVGLALSALGELTGESASEAVLDQIFRRFCIGK